MKGTDADAIELCNFQLSCLPKYDQSMALENFYEPHDDIAERYWAVTIVYCSSEYTDDNWVGGELALYKNTTYINYPDNIINIKPYRNRMVMFPGYYIHRIKPYFGNLPRQSIVYGWEIHPIHNKKSILV
jgi:Rps23 Pro-64 3,4-dihydroxylase Tpa1-like proline 4-hydroxylase